MQSCPGVRRCQSLTSRAISGGLRLGQGQRPWEAPGGQGNAEGSHLPLSGCGTPELWGKPRQSSEGEMLQGSSSGWLLRSRLPGPGLGAVATKKVHFGFNLIKRINNYQLSQFELTIPSAEVHS